MNWLETYNFKVLNYELLLRDPIFLKNKVKKAFNLRNSISVSTGISVGKLKDNDSMLHSYKSMLDVFTITSKISVLTNKGKFGKKSLKINLKLNKFDSLIFLDFFLNIMLKSLKRRYISLHTNMNDQGIFNFRFENLTELELDDYFFLDLYEWKGSLSVFFKYSYYSTLSKMYGIVFLNIFRLKNFSKYEVSVGKG